MSTETERYRLLEKVASGGMGEVFRALDRGHGDVERVVAIKRIAPELGRDPDFATTFLAEAKLSFLLGHANIVRVLDIGLIDDHLCLVLEWIDGADLGTLIDTLRRDSQQAMPTRLALTIIAEAARGLDYAHRVAGPDGQPLGIVHRDVSPSNLLLSVEGEVKVTDFGIARSRLRRSQSMPGLLKGKLFYMSPEQARGDVDPRADVFALGAVLYEMLCGENPYTVSGGDHDLLERVRSARFPSPREHAPGMTPELEAIVLRAMAPLRDDRFASCAELRAAIEQYALQSGYVLSLDELARFVRALSTTGFAAYSLSPKSPSGKHAAATVAPAKPKVSFDFGALGGRSETAAVAPIASAPVASEPPSVAAATATAPAPPPEPTPPVASVTGARPVQQHRVLDATATPPSSPAARPARGRFIPLAAALVALIGVFAWWRRPAPTPPPAITPPAPAPAPDPAPVPAPAPVVAPAPAPAPRRLRPASSPARLTIETDRAADIFIDEELIGRSPVRDHELMPGTHVVRAASTSRGLFLIPRERTIAVRSGETKRVFLALDGGR